MKTADLNPDSITIELTEFEITALVALVERGQEGVAAQEGDYACIRTAINEVADEFRSLLGHFELVA